MQISTCGNHFSTTTQVMIISVRVAIALLLKAINTSDIRLTTMEPILTKRLPVN